MCLLVKALSLPIGKSTESFLVSWVACHVKILLPPMSSGDEDAGCCHPVDRTTVSGGAGH